MVKTSEYKDKDIKYIEEELLKVKVKRKSKRIALGGAFAVSMILAIILHIISYFMLKKLHLVGYREVPKNVYTLSLMYSLWAYIIVGFVVAWFLIQLRENRTIQKLKIAKIMKINKERKIEKKNKKEKINART